MTLTEMDEELAAIEEEIADIKGQMEKAVALEQEDGVKYSRIWYAKARAAARYKQIELTELRTKRGMKAKSERVEANFRNHFYYTARQQLTAEHFAEIERLTREKIA